jgi:hypothetical protein
MNMMPFIKLLGGGGGGGVGWEQLFHMEQVNEKFHFLFWEFMKGFIT